MEKIQTPDHQISGIGASEPENPSKGIRGTRLSPSQSSCESEAARLFPSPPAAWELPVIPFREDGFASTPYHHRLNQGQIPDKDTNEWFLGSNS